MNPEDIYSADIAKIERIEENLSREREKIKESSEEISERREQQEEISESRREFIKEKFELEKSRNDLVSKLQNINLLEMANYENIFGYRSLEYLYLCLNPNHGSKTQRAHQIIENLPDLYKSYENHTGKPEMTISGKGIHMRMKTVDSDLQKSIGQRAGSTQKVATFSYLPPINPFQIVRVDISSADRENIRRFNKGRMRVVPIRDVKIAPPEGEDFEKFMQNLYRKVSFQFPSKTRHINEKLRKIDEQKKVLDNNYNKLEEEVQFLQSLPGKKEERIEQSLHFLDTYKGLMRRSDHVTISKVKGHYTLCLGESGEVFRYDKDSAEMIFATRKSDPFSIKSIDPSQHMRKSVDFGIAGTGDFMTPDGVKLYGEAQSFAQHLFYLVENGIRVFPPRNGSSRYRIDPEQKKDLEELVSPRTWGQTIIESHNPDNISFGEFFASGEYCKIYTFGQYVLVESNISDRATYVLGSNELENLRSKSRSYLRDEKPKGFVDRVVHPGDRDDLRMNWVERISPYLTKAD